MDHSQSTPQWRSELGRGLYSYDEGEDREVWLYPESYNSSDPTAWTEGTSCTMTVLVLGAPQFARQLQRVDTGKGFPYPEFRAPEPEHQLHLFVDLLHAGVGDSNLSDWPLSADDIWDLYVLAERYELSPTYRSILGVFIEAILPAEPHKHPGWWEEPLSAMEMMEASTTKMKLHIVAHKLHLGRLWTSLLIGPKYKSSVGATIKQMEEYFDTVTSIMLVIRTAELHGSADGGVVVKYTRGNELYLVSSADEGKILHHF